MRVDFQPLNLKRLVSVYSDNAGLRWWTKAWFGDDKKPAPSVEIELWQAIQFLKGHVEKDHWLEEFFPKNMEVIKNSVLKIREKLLNQLLTT